MEWYQNWFNQIYADLYAHRNVEQAEKQVEVLLEAIQLPPVATILDVGCGAGRHLATFLNKKHQAFGMDLSVQLLNLAEQPKRLVRADMSKIPFQKQTFDLVTSFFSSFGYFKTPKQDLKMFQQMKDLLKPKGWLFLDLAHRDVVLQNLIPYDEREFQDYKVIQKRSVEGRIVIKDIEIINSKCEKQNYQECLRLYSLSELKDILATENIQLVKVFGNEKGDEFTEKSPRMSLILRKI